MNFMGHSFAPPAADSANNNSINDVIGNKSDEESGDSLYALAHTINHHLHYASFVRPDLDDGVLLSSDAGVWAAYPVPTEIIASPDIGSLFDLHFMNVSTISANGEYQVALYTGAAMSEVLIGVFAISRSAVQSQEGTRPIGTIVVPADTRISAALSSNNAGANTVIIKLEGHMY